VWEHPEFDTTKVTVTGSAASALRFYGDNRLNEGDSFMKYYDAAIGNVTVGTTVPEVIIRAPAGKEVLIHTNPLTTFGTAITGSCVTTAGTGGTTSPSNDVVGRVHF
jgi:hypothetical protein